MDNSADKRQTESVILKESRREQAVEAFLGGCNCAQAVFSTYADLFGIDRRTAMNLTNSMGGGISRAASVVVGEIMPRSFVVPTPKNPVFISATIIRGRRVSFHYRKIFFISLKDIDDVSSLENYDQIAYLPGC